MTDPFDLDDEETTEQADPPAKSPAEQRLDKEKAKLRKQIEELTAWKAEREKADRGATVESIAKELGLNPKHAAFYQDDDSSPEAIRAWAIANDFLVPAESEEPAPAPATGFTPTVVSDSSAVGSKTYSLEEFEKLARMDPAKAQQVYKAGRVEKESSPWSVGQPLTFKHDSLDKP